MATASWSPFSLLPTGGALGAPKQTVTLVTRCLDSCASFHTGLGTFPGLQESLTAAVCGKEPSHRLPTKPVGKRASDRICSDLPCWEMVPVLKARGDIWT